MERRTTGSSCFELLGTPLSPIRSAGAVFSTLLLGSELRKALLLSLALIGKAELLGGIVPRAATPKS